MKRITFAFAVLLACGPVTSRLNDARPADGVTYHYARLSRSKGKAMERLADPTMVVSRLGEQKGGKSMYVIRDAGVAAIPRFGFHEIEKATIEVKLRRLSDIDGSGTEPGSVRRLSEFQRDYDRADVSKAYLLLQALVADPSAAAKKEDAAAWAEVANPERLDPHEGGFVVETTAELVTGNPLDPTAKVVLYRVEARSEYAMAQDASP